MASTDFDVVIGGTSAKIAHLEGGGYRRRTIRREVEQDLLSQSETPALTSRFDQRQVYQTSWAGGSRWWKPLLAAEESDSYFQSNHMDVWSEPGKVVPSNKVVDAANTILHDNCVMATDDSGDVYAIGSTNTTNATFLDVYKWTPASDAFVRETTFHSGIPAAEAPISMVFDPNDGYFYVFNVTDTEVTRFNPSTPAQDAAWLDLGMTNAAEILLHREGLIRYAAGDSAISLIIKATPTFENKFNDGMGNDLLAVTSVAGTNPIMRRISPAISTPEGIYYFRNVINKGQPMAWVFRVERDAAGNWNGEPIATLPVGTVALSITYHMGNVIIAASPDWRTILRNDTDEAEVILYFVSEQSGLGALGSLLGGRDELDETPYALLGSSGPLLYIGGHKRLWVYDAVRGGIHSAFEWGTELSNGAYVAMAFVEDSDGDTAMIFLGRDRIARTKLGNVDDPDTVVAFGDDETHYVLTSNYIDGGLPMETKELTKVAILRDADDAGSEWTVQVAADGGSFADALVDAGTAQYAEAALSGTTGRRFQYRLIYQTKDTARKALEALLVTFTTGEMLTEWDITLDGSELLNIDNELQDEETFYDAMKTLADTSAITTLVDNFQEQGRETDTATTVSVKVQAVEIVKEKPGESMVRVVLREA